MIVVFAAPVLATWFYYFFPEYLPEARSNRGEIINPAIGLPEGLELRTPDGAPFDPNSLQGAWTLVYLADGGCSEPCTQSLVELRQIRLGLGENRNFVERLLLIADPQGPVDGDLMERAFEGMRVAEMDRSAAERLLSALGTGPEGLDRVYILDPQGRLMMRYPAGAPPKDTLKDMERLLKGSKNWIKGASYGHN
jgi:cytochrome oxidase Cu insertion factor (SCO1/SenC/PrrC family)